MYEKNLFDLKEESYGKFDVIFFPGILYHLRYPIYALKIVADVLNEGGTLLIETAILLEDKNRAILYCPTNDDGPYGSTSCAFFNSKGLVDTLKSLGVETLEYQLPIKENFIKNLIKSILRFFKLKAFFGKNLTSVSRGLFMCKKDSSIIKRNDHVYWNSSHKRHSIYQKESKSYKDLFKERK
jgi:SAM-dependent methyltransferase